MSSGAKSLRSLLLAFVSPSLESPSPQLHDEVRKSTGRHNRKRCRRSGAEIYETWLASRALTHEKGEYLAPGAHRPLSRSSLKLACEITRLCAFDLLNLLWALHPWRTVLMVSLEFIRGVFPVFRGYSQALLINELQSLVSNENFTWSRLTKFIVAEIVRICLESVIDCFASSNENMVHSSARYLIEYKQLEVRVRLDMPTLADPTIRDLLHESDLFVRSFSGMASFGLFSTFDFMRTLTLVSELISHVLVLSSLTFNGPHVPALIFSVLSSVLPLVLSWLGNDRTYLEDHISPQEARAAAKQDKMRLLAHSDGHRPEIILFGLGPWIIHSWARARKIMLGLEQHQSAMWSTSPSRLLSDINIPGLFTVAQNIPLVFLLQSPSASLGSFTFYRSSIQSLFFTASNLLHTLRMAYQGIFLMGAFCAAMEIEPHLQPKTDKVVRYRSFPRGMKIQARDLSFTYPGSKEPMLKKLNFTVEAGEILAIVGFNGSGKSTLAKVLLRLLDFDGGELLVNDVDIRRYYPAEYHEHITAVFQDFSRFNASAQENIGVGYVNEMRNSAAIEVAMRLAGVGDVVLSLPKGLKTKLDVAGHDPVGSSVKEAYNSGPAYLHHGLSGGEWQRIAISRSFMRAHRPEVDLILLDEPTSSLDGHAQNQIFDSIEKVSRSTTGERTKTVIFITHRLSTARRADKIAMMENGTISEFGTHQELLKRNGQYAALYQASI
ncbi:hypothetical protein AcW1_004692 [Taiwanofungus camphoratus]|nr:hypothetical protein AcW2_006305 [Antrodia cinnamomea]KAI0960064.1 hypothetical protein AcW1_004692 [Antrodia cinnamomea]